MRKLKNISRREQLKTEMLSDHLYMKAMDATSEMFACYDTDLRLQWANKIMAESFKSSREDLLGRFCYELWHGLKAPCKECHLRRAMETGQAQSGETTTRDGRYWAVRSYPILDHSGKLLGAMEFGTDISEKKRAESTLRQQEARFRTVFESSPVGIAMLSEDETIIAANRKLCQMLGYSADEITTLTSRDLSFKEDYDAEQSLRRQLHDQAGFSYCMDKRYICKDGSLLWGHLTTSIFREEDVPIRVKIVEDISRQREAQSALLKYQNELRMLSSSILLAEEHERKRIAAGLHDNIAQMLAWCKLKLLLLEREELQSSVVEVLRDVNEHLEKCIMETRSLVFEISPPVLYELGLLTALDWLGEEYEKKYGLHCTVFSDKKTFPDLPEDVKSFFFQAVREMLQNVIKHARATRAWITVHTYDKIVSIDVEDDGKGFASKDLDQNSEKKGFGLFSIKERAGLLGGRLEKRRGASGGALLSLEVPLNSK